VFSVFCPSVPFGAPRFVSGVSSLWLASSFSAFLTAMSHEVLLSHLCDVPLPSVIDLSSNSPLVPLPVEALEAPGLFSKTLSFRFFIVSALGAHCCFALTCPEESAVNFGPLICGPEFGWARSFLQLNLPSKGFRFFPPSRCQGGVCRAGDLPRHCVRVPYHRRF